MSHEFNKEVDGKKDESCVVHTDGPLRPSLRHRQVFFKSSWDFFLVVGKEKKNTKTVLLKGVEKSQYKRKELEQTDETKGSLS